MSEDRPFVILPEEREKLYIFLSARELSLDAVLDSLKRRLEADLYNRYSIEEMERVIRQVRDAQKT